jgi:hypothetical protein
MSSKADYSAQEWSELKQGPALAGIHTVLADSGGTVRESMSIAKCYGDAHERWWGPPHAVRLVDELVAEGPELDRAAFGSLPDKPRGDQIAQLGLDRLRNAVAILEDKATPEELEDYRAFVLALARRVAEAHKEGAFLGIGGKRISDREQAALDEVAQAVGADGAEDASAGSSSASDSTAPSGGSASSSSPKSEGSRREPLMTSSGDPSGSRRPWRVPK